MKRGGEKSMVQLSLPPQKGMPDSGPAVTVLVAVAVAVTNLYCRCHSALQDAELPPDQTQSKRSCRGDLTTMTTIFCSLNPVCFGAEMQTEHLTVLLSGTQNSF